MLAEILIIGLILTSLVMVVIGILSIKEKFVRRYFLFVAVLAAVFFTATIIVSAQEKPTEKKEHKMMQQEDMEKCMDKIAADDHMSKMMMDKLLEHSKTDTAALMDMCKTMMSNSDMHKMMMNKPEMRKMMMDMMHGEGMMKHDMKDEKNDSLMKKDTEHKSHH